MKWLSGALSARGVTLYANSVHWGPLLDRHQEKMERAVAREGSSNRMLQRAGMSVGGDALSYRYSQDAINLLFDYEYSSLRADDVIIFSHSLGCVLATDWMRSRRLARVSQLVTLGCNLEAFNQNNEAQWAAECPWQVRGPRTWTNCFDAQDMLGWPVRHWLPWVRDVEVDVGGLLTRWWGVSHMGYWTDRTLWRETVPRLILGA
ncbi:MAG: hypothetical protein RLZZ450_81 [Pseudomonadota bacterium]|jgi:hypothetical protein